MLVGPFQLLQAKQAEIEAGVQYIDALRDYWIARAQLQQVDSGRATDTPPAQLHLDDHATKPADSHQHQHHDAATTKPAATTTAAGYTCPMHPEVLSSTPGRCPKCRMKLVSKK